MVIAILSAGGCSGGNVGEFRREPRSVGAVLIRPNRCVVVGGGRESMGSPLALPLAGAIAGARPTALAVLDGMDRAEIVQADENHIHAPVCPAARFSWTTWEF